MKRGRIRGDWGRRFAAGLLGMVWTCGAMAADPVETFPFGQAEVGARLDHRFELRNSGGGELKVRGVTPSCDCIRVVRWTSDLAAGETGTIDVVFVPDRIGTVDYRVVASLDADGGSTVEYAIQGEVVAASSAWTGWRRDRSLRVPAGEVPDLVAHPERAVWVDVRADAQRAQVSMPGALPIPAHAIKTKGFLRSRKTVVMDDMGGSRALEEECRAMRAAGFEDLWIWPGGIQEWRRQGGQLEGIRPEEADQVPVLALRDILEAEDWLVVFVDGGGGHGVAGAADIPATSGDEDGMARALRAELDAREGIASVLLIAEDGDVPSSVARAAAGCGAGIYRLAGGWSAWEAYRRITGTAPGRKAVSAQGPGPRKCGGCSR